ncbi:MAG TPA: PadR family transcriptional regulator [Acidobacteriota bacterium]|nr:PadR family transcriptional regulator [Acidobacteriota bacterium]
MKGDTLGEFEELVLLAVCVLEEEAYGVSILERIEEDAQRTVSIGAVYSALRRLEKKGYVSSHLGDVTPERGGRRKRLFRVSPEGLQALRHLRQVRERLWSQLEVESGGEGGSG